MSGKEQKLRQRYLDYEKKAHDLGILQIDHDFVWITTMKPKWVDVAHKIKKKVICLEIKAKLVGLRLSELDGRFPEIKQLIDEMVFRKISYEWINPTLMVYGYEATFSLDCSESDQGQAQSQP